MLVTVRETPISNSHIRKPKSSVILELYVFYRLRRFLSPTELVQPGFQFLVKDGGLSPQIIQ
jgi:hypothetical protein